MNKRTENQINGMLRAVKRRRWHVALLVFLAMVVTAGVAGIFHHPAITKTYQVTVLTCSAVPHADAGSADFFVHIHNDDCYDAAGNLVCPLPEIRPHRHTSDCFVTTRTLICTIPESDGHQHSEACYTRVRGDLICTLSTEPVLDEAGNVLEEGHVHTDECFAWTEELTCGLEAGEGAHHHDDSCYETSTMLTCGEPEILLHTHTDACYQKNEDGSIYVDEDGNTWLICGQLQVTEHVHGPECFTTYELDDWKPESVFMEEKEQPAESEIQETGSGDGVVTDDSNTDPAVDNTSDTEDAGKTETAENTEEAEYSGEPEGKVSENGTQTDESNDDADDTDLTSDTNVIEKTDNVDLNTDGENQEAATGEEAPIVEEPHTVVYTGTRGAEKAGMTVLAELPDGALDENAQLILGDADESAARKQVLKVVNEYAAEGEEREISSMLLMDISFVSGGAPATLNGLDPIRVTLRAAAIRGMSAPRLFHLTGGTAHEITDVIFDTQAGSAVFTSSSFSPFAVVDLTDEETVEETVSVSMPAQDFHGATDEVEVFVSAPEGAFPAGTTMHVTTVPQEEVIGALNDAANGVMVRNVQAVDISFRNAEGEEIEPLLPISVKMSRVAKEQPATTEAAPEAKESVVLHVENDGSAQIVENANVTDTEAEFESDSFSTYIMADFLTEEFLASNGHNYRISVTYGAAAGIPENADLNVEELTEGSSAYETYVANTESALGMEEGSAGYIRLFDIGIVDKNDPSVRYQPAEGTTVDVKIELADSSSETLSVVHFADGSSTGDVVTAETDGQTVRFEAEGFSIYAITDSSKRLQYNFYDGTNLLVSEYIKKQDNVLQVLYDPGVEPEYGQAFIGWAYAPNETNPSKIYTIEELNHQAADRYSSATEELTVVDVYAIYDEAWYLRYMDQDAQGDAIVLNVVRVRKDAANKDVTITYTFTPEEGIVFDGWIDVATGETYQQGDTITLDHHVDLYVKLHGRNWLVFDANAGGPGSGATYTPPQLLIGDEATTEKPADPTRRGYTFTGWNTKADGTGTWWYRPNGSVNEFGNTLADDTTLYAQWEPDDTDYYVVFWKQKATDAAGLADSAKQYDYVSSEKRTAKTGATVSTTNADQQKGGAANREYGYYFTYNGINSDRTATVDANGTTVLNVYYDRREITYNFTSPSYSSATYGRYGLVNDEYVQLYYSGLGGYRQVGDNDNHNTVYYIGVTGYDWWGNEQYGYLRYNGTRYTQENQTQSFTGLYGSTFSEWPDPGNGRVWQTTYRQQTLSLPLALTLFDPEAALAPGATQTTVYFSSSSYSTGLTMTVYVQTEEGAWEYSNDYILTTANLGKNGTWYPTETFEGFTVDSYQIRGTLDPNGTWTPVTSSDSFSYNNNVFLRYSRNQHKIHFISQGNNVTGRTENIVDGVYYESSLSKYAEGGSAYYEPTNGKEGYYFAGWYSDPDCQIPFDFNTTMPDNDITVYAKWDTYRVRVVLVPTPNNEHDDEVQLANSQALAFRLDYNESVDDTNINSSVAKRAGYKLIGWYYSPDFDPSTEIHFPLTVNKDTPGVNMDYQTSEDWNKYGDNDGSHDNVRGILKLYAKWELDVDENSVYVEYDVDDVYRTYDSAGMLQTTIPVDDHKYALTNDKVTFQVAEAPTEYTSGFEFYRWVLLNPDGSESEIEFSPGGMASEIPSSYIYGETITDDEGQTATIKKLRLKAKFNIETEKVTTVTYDGNGGVTNDSAANERVTESYPVNKDFTMKDGDSFVREGYTLLGWAFEREDGSKITADSFEEAIAEMTADQLIQAGIYQLGKEVAADNLKVSDENNWDPLENTVYAVWKINTYTVTVKKIVDGETATDKSFKFSVTADESYTISDEDASFSLVNGGEKIFAEVPYGTELTFAETPASGYSIQSVEAKQTSRPDKTELEKAEYITLTAADGKPYTIKGKTVITYINEKAKEQKLRIKKIGEDTEGVGLAGAKFDLKAAEGTTIEGFTDLTDRMSMDGETVPAKKGYLPGNDSTDDTLFTLPIGAYSLTETKAPAYYDGISGGITLSVTGEGISVTSVGDDYASPFDKVEISEPDADGVYTLTVTNTRKKADFTVEKIVDGLDTDKTTPFKFTVTYTVPGEEAVSETFNLTHDPVTTTDPTTQSTKIISQLPYGTVIKVSETANDDFTTTAKSYIKRTDSDGGESSEYQEVPDSYTPGTEITIGGASYDSNDIKVTFTNTRNRQPVSIWKTDLNHNTLTGASFALYKAEDYDDATGKPMDGKTPVIPSTAVNENGILALGSLTVGQYKLVETQAPAGYNMAESAITITVNPNGVLAIRGTSQTEIARKGDQYWGTGQDDATWQIHVWNNPGVELPSTGGPGTALFTAIGGIMTAVAGAVLTLKRRKEHA